MSLCTVIALTAFTGSAAPVYQTQSVFGGESGYNYYLHAFNNQRDICGTADNSGAFIRRGNLLLALPQMAAPQVTGVGIARGMNNVDSNGVVRIVGFVPVSVTNADQSMVSDRGCCWLVYSNNVIAQETMPNYLDPNTGDEVGGGDAYDVNDSGEAVGYGGGIWAGGGYSYGNAQLGIFSGNNFNTSFSLDNSGDMIVPGYDWYHATVNEHVSDLIYPYGELPGYNSPYGTNGVDASQIRNGYVVGSALLANQKINAFAWHIGDSLLTALPDPDQWNSRETWAVSVNSAGDVVGWGIFTNGDSGLFRYVLWKRNSVGGYNAHLLDDVVVDQMLTEEESDTILINDRGDIALDYASYDSFGLGQQIMVVTPVGGQIIVTDTNGNLGSTSVNQTDKVATVVVSVQRADGFTGPISVQYTTADETAAAGIHYTNVTGTLTWNAGDSSDKVVEVPLISIHSGVQYEDFAFVLSNPVNAAFGHYGYGSNLDVSIFDNGGTFAFSKTNYSVANNWTNATLTVNRNGGSDGAATLAYQTYDDTAAAGSDYTAANGVLTWTAGDSSPRQITIPIAELNAGANVDFYVDLSVQSADSGTAATGDPAVVTITRPGHPVAPALGTLAPGTPSAPTLTFQLDGTQGGVFDVQTTTNLFTNSWKTMLTFTNASDRLQISNGFSVSIHGKFYRLMAK